MTTWILVADEFRARLFKQQDHGAALVELADITHPEGRMHDSEMTRGPKPGAQSVGGSFQHSIEPQTSVEEKVAQEFARELAARLEQGRVRHEYDELVLVATPKFLGKLRASLDKEVSRLLVKSIDKGFTRASPEEIRKAIGGQPAQ